jgi:ribosome recycling factor
MNDWKQRMHKAVRHLGEQLSGIRPGSLSVGFIETFRVPVQGDSIPVRHLGRVMRTGDRIIITPFDQADVPAVVKALVDSKLNGYALDRTKVCVSIPPISGEQRSDIARHVKKLSEEAKVAVRAIRQDARKQIAARGRGSERVVQEATDSAIHAIEQLVKEKITGLEA